ncbi:MAG: SGNH/GDSL hydrolase family protein [Planctomyces sp.]|nr:SGNH/GDSL hydrolase family protein [Planctomyces sp.]
MLFRPKRMLRNLIVAVGLLISAVIGAEFWLRATTGPAVDLVASRAVQSVQVLLKPSAIRHHELLPGATLQMTSASGRQARIRIGPAGFRESSDGSESRPSAGRNGNRFRILFLGDDTVFGTGVDQQYTVTSLLQELLSKRLDTEVEVINAGVPGYCPLLSALQYREQGRDLKPDLVILHFDMTDIADDACYRRLLIQNGEISHCVHSSLKEDDSGRTPERDSFWKSELRRSALARLTIDHVQEALEGRSAATATTDAGDSAFAWLSDDPPDMRLQVRHALEPIQLVKQLADESGAKFLLTSTPIHWQIVSSDVYPELTKQERVSGVTPYSSQLPSEVLKQFCSDRGIRLLDCRQAFSQSEAGIKLFSRGHLTPSEIGMALYAKQIADFLTRRSPSDGGS